MLYELKGRFRVLHHYVYIMIGSMTDWIHVFLPQETLDSRSVSLYFQFRCQQRFLGT